ncbi:MAG: DUF4845 domain-containing protein [Gammaproteobacteria bacterium]|nr:DUF4845 domain-containing protein [Gammaproteobacteria bacterium]
MRARQQGITLIGFIIVAAFVGVFGFGILKVTPFYLEQMKVVSIMDDTKRNLDNSQASAPTIRREIENRLNIEMVYNVQLKDFVIKKTQEGHTVAVKYEWRDHYLGNLYLVSVFDRTVEIDR